MKPCYNCGSISEPEASGRNRQIKGSLAVLALASLLFIACQVLSMLQAGAAGKVLFQDDFARPTSGWSQVQLPQGSTGYSQGSYRIYVATPHTEIWGYPGLSFKDVRLEVDAARVSGAKDNIFGALCRYRDDRGFYAFFISSDGYYGIARYQGGRFDLLGAQALPPTEKIRQGAASNRLRADCVEDRLALYVNDELLVEQADSSLRSGDVGLIAGTLGNPGTEILFDNFTVLIP